jgi:hypothetical protein
MHKNKVARKKRQLSKAAKAAGVNPHTTAVKKTAPAKKVAAKKTTAKKAATKKK